jgi:hypothetical protein
VNFRRPDKIMASTTPGRRSVTQQLTHASSSEQLELLVEVAARIRTAVDSVVQGKPGLCGRP